MTDPRQANADSANSVVGWTAPSEDYLNLIDPGDPTPRQRAVAEASDCGLVALGIQEITFDIPVRGPYKDSSAFNLMYARACGNPWAPGGAFRLATLDAPPQLGDVTEYGPAPSGSPPAHMETVLDSSVDGNKLSLTCAAGGERVNGLETIKIMKRTFTWGGAHWIDDQNKRPIIGVVDVELLASMYPLKAA